MAGTYHSTDDLLIEVDWNNVINDSDENGQQETSTQIKLDPSSGAPIIPLSEESDDIPKDSIEMKFKMNNINSNQVVYFSNETVKCLYPVTIDEASIDNSEGYIEYVTKIFEIYDSLGEDRIFNIPMMGLINKMNNRNHDYNVNLSMEMMISELEIFIDKIKNDCTKINRFYQLENCLSILNCLRIMYFIMDGSEEDSVMNGNDMSKNQIENDKKRQIFINGLIKWVNRSDGEPNADFIEQVFDSTEQLGEEELPENSPQGARDSHVFETEIFWKLINQLIIRGLFSQAIGCIDRSGLKEYLLAQCDVSSNALLDIISLLKEYPADSLSTFREWKNLALELLQNYSMNDDISISGDLRDSIEDTLLIISGDKNCILKYSQFWYESICGFYLFYIPSLELIKTEYLAWSIKKNTINVVNSWEVASKDLMQGKIYPILPILEKYDLATSSFTSGLCQAKGLLEPEIEEQYGIVNYMINSFAFEICSKMNNKKLWPIAIGLICNNPNNSNTYKRITIGELIAHFPYETNDDLEWLLSICAEWKLIDVAKKIYMQLGNTMMYEGNTIEAMKNFSKGGNIEMVKHYSWMLFEASILQSKPLDDIILNTIVSDDASKIDSDIPEEILDKMVTNTMRQTLSPYGVLFKFFQLIEEEKFSSALELLLLLINFQYLPKHYLVLITSKLLYPIYLMDDTKKVSEESILILIEVIEKEWDCKDEKSIIIYQRVIAEEYEKESEHMNLDQDDKQNRKATNYPGTIEDFLKQVRRLLNFKLCDDYIIL
ncbi:hypothetical protein TBLA_0C01660 [Henningerozyma blattae CBS 6284]|uniref:Nuclear pore complex protein Nup85 n=1 Tax=Henningerozyma blattae (strain ATCC 34711 / CBS 6284 / DSM 70876 / NBRC 10599 / NRRL Y-10934 / UCD 77-7) TaxID=1071380 RepID=I2H0S8_HENB6|nr:hypothetical protein TBLA_0C01660 [Tetrapisispora blattae CBS 6284]CCH59980.1 hypothetical protein TBLA_0C01660 [Tetrapisispora blattae CBS 6284]